MSKSKPKSATKTVKKVDAEKGKREAFRLYEEVMSYFKAHALDGEYYPDDLLVAKAAFDTMNVGTLRELCDTYKTTVDFISVNDVLRGNLKRMKPVKLEGGKTRKFRMEDYTMADRVRLLSETPGTEMYAGTLLRVNAERTPFDE